MQNSFKWLKAWYEGNKTTIFISFIVFVLTIHYAPYFLNRNFEGNFEGSIHNKLVWSVKGECYFVRPISQTDTILVRVKDCDKAEPTFRSGREKNESK